MDMAVTPMSSRRWIAVLAALLLALTLAPATAHAGKESVAGRELQAQPAAGQADLSADIRLEEATRRTVRGVPIDGGCQFSGQETAGNDPRPVLERSVALDTTTCAMVVERGYVPAEHVEKVSDGAHEAGAAPGVSSSTEYGTPASEQDAGTDEAGIMLTRRREAWHRTWWRDPPGIVVNSVKTNVRWTYDWSCTSNGNYWTDYTWFSGSGWSKQASNTQIFNGCIAQTTSSYAHFRNGIFCFTIDTHAYYDRTVISGRIDGSYLMSWNTWVSGGCTSLLSFQRSHGFTQIF
jgi:hypothetical protein